MRDNLDHTRFFLVEKNLTGDGALHLASELNHMPMHEWNRMYLNFGKVKKIDATGLAVLVRLYSQLSTNGKKLQLIDVSQPVHELFNRHGLCDLFLCNPKNELHVRKTTRHWKPADSNNRRRTRPTSQMADRLRTHPIRFRLQEQNVKNRREFKVQTRK